MLEALVLRPAAWQSAKVPGIVVFSEKAVAPVSAKTSMLQQKASRDFRGRR
jgi:hypothetical protein